MPQSKTGNKDTGTPACDVVAVGAPSGYGCVKGCWCHAVANANSTLHYCTWAQFFYRLQGAP